MCGKNIRIGMAMHFQYAAIEWKIVTMETFFEKRSLLINIKIKAVMNFFLRDISIYFLKSFSSKIFFIKY